MDEQSRGLVKDVQTEIDNGRGLIHSPARSHVKLNAIPEIAKMEEERKLQPKLECGSIKDGRVFKPEIERRNVRRPSKLKMISNHYPRVR